MNEFSLAILSPDREWFVGPVVSVVAPGADGELGVLADHIPMVAGLKMGVATVRLANEKILYFAVDGGVLGVQKKGVRLLTGAVVSCDTFEKAQMALGDLKRSRTSGSKG